jgi:hypothetical protein
VPHTETVRAYVDAFNAGEWERLKNLFDPAANIRGVLGWGRLRADPSSALADAKAHLLP